MSDIVARLKHQQREQEAQRICLLKIRERGLAMKLARVEQLFDGSRLIFYYLAEKRVDFRELVKDLARALRTPDRDAADRRAGRGQAARRLRRLRQTRLLHDAAAGLRADVDQDGQAPEPRLNPAKLSGRCGRLKCCLRYELPNGKGVVHGGCADEGGCGSCDNPTGPGATAGVARVAAAAAASAADSTSALPSSSALCLTQRSHSALQRHAVKRHPIDDGERPEISRQLPDGLGENRRKPEAGQGADQCGRESQVACESQEAPAQSLRAHEPTRAGPVVVPKLAG